MPIFTIVHYKYGVDLGLRLREQHQLWSVGTNISYSTTQQGNGSIPYFNMPAGSEGWIVARCFTLYGATNSTFLESPIVTFLDYGGAPPAFNSGSYLPQEGSSGGEDGLYSGYYFTYEEGNVAWSPYFMAPTVGTSSPYATVVCQDWLARDGVHFSNGAYMTSVLKYTSVGGAYNQAGMASSTTLNAGWVVFYYTPY
jgi:hypothetical protein